VSNVLEIIPLGGIGEWHGRPARDFFFYLTRKMRVPRPSRDFFFYLTRKMRVPRPARDFFFTSRARCACHIPPVTTFYLTRKMRVPRSVTPTHRQSFNFALIGFSKTYRTA